MQIPHSLFSNTERRAVAAIAAAGVCAALLADAGTRSASEQNRGDDDHADGRLQNLLVAYPAQFRRHPISTTSSSSSRLRA